MKKILYLAQSSPLAPFSGFAYRAFGVLNWLINRFSVDVIFEGDAKDLKASFLPLKSFGNIVAIPNTSGYFQKLACVIGLLPYHHRLSCFSSMRNMINRMIRENSYDLIWINKTVHFPILNEIRGLPPVIVDQHASEPHVWDNLIKNDPRWWAKWFFSLNKYKVTKYDKDAYKKVSGVICITEQDQAKTEAYYPGTKTLFIPQGIDPVYYYPDQTAMPDINTLLFSGTDAVRNLQAINILIKDTMPIVHNKCKDMRLLWIGNVQASKHPFLKLPWIETTGFVEHAPPYFDRGMIYVAPFDMGEGMKTKIVEAMAMGKVIVSTPVGVDGINVEGLPFVKVCKSREEFAEAIISFRNTPNLNDLGKCAREYALTHYTWEKILAPLDVFLTECLDIR
jgi:polysaccharide biosynthesis protein PslH